MSCAIEMIPKLIIDDILMGRCEWDEGDDIHLILTNGDFISGRIEQILSTELTVTDKEKGHTIVSFEEIESYI